MAYPRSGATVRIPMFSTGSQNRKWNNFAVGDTEVADNVRVINERRFAVSNFKGNDGGVHGSGCVSRLSCENWSVTCLDGTSFAESNCATQDNFRCVWGIEDAQLRWKFEACNSHGGVPGYGGGGDNGDGDGGNPPPTGHGCGCGASCGTGAECAFNTGKGCDPGLGCTPNSQLGSVCYSEAVCGGTQPPPPNCNNANVTLSVSPNPRVGQNVTFTVSGSEGDLHVEDTWTGGVNCSGGFWGSKTCAASSAGKYTWTHRWRKCQRDNTSNCSSPCSKSIEFTVSDAAQPPPQPINLNPSGTISCGVDYVIFSWNQSDTASSYSLRIDDKSNGWNGSCDSPNSGDTCRSVTGTSFTRAVVPGRTYAWWVHSVNAYGSSQPANATFTVPASCVSALSSIHQTEQTAVPNGQNKQDHVSADGRQLVSRFYQNNSWQNWTAFSASQVGAPVNTFRSFSQSNVPGTSTPKQDLLSSDGQKLYYRMYENGKWGVWSTIIVSNLGLPGGISKVAAYSMTNGDAATSGRPKQNVLSADGNIIYFRFYQNNSWQPWMSVTVGNLNIPGISQIRAFTQSKVPSSNIPKQEALTIDGKKVWYRQYQNGVWGAWNSYLVSSLKIAGPDQPLQPLP